ncbi:hypothetical protein FA13DRAFT_1714371 [Coprinellus micaceus]|uniref:Uncharacterized protein n=1 Tax=Coprinellus micaceus TaxID=71717 RepID=A0A4Y7STI5_COPMI|nr:hypothetical protein FA13DRAFT_1714371 [Coprinellus micaceus]
MSMSVGERNGMQAHLFGKPRSRKDDINGRTGKEHCVRRVNGWEDWSVGGERRSGTASAELFGIRRNELQFNQFQDSHASSIDFSPPPPGAVDSLHRRPLYIRIYQKKNVSIQNNLQDIAPQELSPGGMEFDIDFGGIDMRIFDQMPGLQFPTLQDAINHAGGVAAMDEAFYRDLAQTADNPLALSPLPPSAQSSENEENGLSLGESEDGTQESRVSIHPSSTASTIPSTGNVHQNASPPSIPSSVRSPNSATLKSIPTSQPDEDEELMDVLPSEQMVKGANVDDPVTPAERNEGSGSLQTPGSWFSETSRMLQTYYEPRPRSPRRNRPTMALPALSSDPESDGERAIESPLAAHAVRKKGWGRHSKAAGKVLCENSSEGEPDGLFQSDDSLFGGRSRSESSNDGQPSVSKARMHKVKGGIKKSPARHPMRPSGEVIPPPGQSRSNEAEKIDSNAPLLTSKNGAQTPKGDANAPASPESRDTPEALNAQGSGVLGLLAPGFWGFWTSAAQGSGFGTALCTIHTGCARASGGVLVKLHLAQGIWPCASCTSTSTRPFDSLRVRQAEGIDGAVLTSPHARASTKYSQSYSCNSVSGTVAAVARRVLDRFTSGEVRQAEGVDGAVLTSPHARVSTKHSQSYSCNSVSGTAEAVTRRVPDRLTSGEVRQAEGIDGAVLTSPHAGYRRSTRRVTADTVSEGTAAAVARRVLDRFTSGEVRQAEGVDGAVLTSPHARVSTKHSQSYSCNSVSGTAEAVTRRVPDRLTSGEVRQAEGIDGSVLTSPHARVSTKDSQSYSCNSVSGTVAAVARRVLDRLARLRRCVKQRASTAPFWRARMRGFRRGTRRVTAAAVSEALQQAVTRRVPGPFDERSKCVKQRASTAPFWRARMRGYRRSTRRVTAAYTAQKCVQAEGIDGAVPGEPACEGFDEALAELQLQQCCVQAEGIDGAVLNEPACEGFDEATRRVTAATCVQAEGIDGAVLASPHARVSTKHSQSYSCNSTVSTAEAVTRRVPDRFTSGEVRQAEGIDDAVLASPHTNVSKQYFTSLPQYGHGNSTRNAPFNKRNFDEVLAQLQPVGCQRHLTSCNSTGSQPFGMWRHAPERRYATLRTRTASHVGSPESHRRQLSNAYLRTPFGAVVVALWLLHLSTMRSFTTSRRRRTPPACVVPPGSLSLRAFETSPGACHSADSTKHNDDFDGSGEYTYVRSHFIVSTAASERALAQSRAETSCTRYMRSGGAPCD